MSPVLEFLIVLAIMLAAAQAAGLVSLRLGLPAVLGELAAGVILGPSLIDIFALDFLDSATSEEGIRLIAELGIVFLMFVAGLETDLEEVTKVRRVAIYAGTLGVLAPILFGTAASVPFGLSFKESLFIGIIISATSVSISARTLMELGALKGRQGLAILAAAVIDDVLVLLILSFFVAFALDEGGSAADGGLIVARMAGFFVAALVAGRWLLPTLARWSAKAPMSEGALATAVVVALLYAWSADYIGHVAAITGAFLAGLFLRQTDVHTLIEDKVRALSFGFLAPVFFVSVGLTADAGGLEAADIGLLVAVCAAAVVSKIVGCGLGAALAGEPPRGALQIGAGMISRGEVGLIIATVGLSSGAIDQDVFSVMILVVLITTLIAPIALRFTFPPAQEGLT